CLSVSRTRISLEFFVVSPCYDCPINFWLSVCSAGAMDYNHRSEVSVLFVLNYTKYITDKARKIWLKLTQCWLG
ncbi:MAG: hypothetical protein OXU23_00825, partial [Candidatus Poribacteria bacterium]|nr:hypothetical protein [Candidatus Poribacteria bacterium]